MNSDAKSLALEFAKIQSIHVKYLRAKILIAANKQQEARKSIQEIIQACPDYHMAKDLLLDNSPTVNKLKSDESSNG